MRITDLEVDGYERVARADDAESGLTAYISVHSTRLGPSLGGMRLWPYASDEAALEDVLRLSRAMTYKSAVARTGLGGGKSVVVADPTDKSDALFEAMGRFVAEFDGTYITAEDVNVGIPDLRAVRRSTEHVTGLTVEEGGGGNPREATALGVFLGVGAALLEATGSSELGGRTVAVQGLGSVGRLLAGHAAEAGARLVVADVNAERVEEAVDQLRAEAVAPERIFDVECDVFSPCATGGVLNADSIASLRCRVIAGAANNQLGEPADAERLTARGILYAPDYVVNAGGVIHLVSYEMIHETDDDVAERLRRIGDTLGEVFARAEADGISTGAAADAIVVQRLAAARKA